MRTMVSKAESEAQYTECQTNDSPVEYNCKISRHKTALTAPIDTDTQSRTRSSIQTPIRVHGAFSAIAEPLAMK